MQFRDLNRQYITLKKQTDEAISEVLNTCDFISGAQVRTLEERLACYVGVKHCVSCASGTDAIRLALMAYGVGAGDAVFVPDFTFFATAEMPALLGAVPVFVDVDEKTYDMDAEKLEKAIGNVEREGKLRPRAVIAVDLFGQCADYGAIRETARKHGLYLIEDAAQSFGGRIGKKRACSFGDIAATSFFPSKPLGCYGDGGAVFTDDDRAAEIMRSLAVHGKGADKYDNVRIGINSRLDTIQAAILLVKLEAFEKYELDAVNGIAGLYSERLKDIVGTPLVGEGRYSSWAQYTVRLKDDKEREKLRAFLEKRDVPTKIYYPRPLHGQPAFAGLSTYGECPVTERLCSRVLSLPIHPYMTKADAGTVAAAVGEGLA